MPKSVIFLDVDGVLNDFISPCLTEDWAEPTAEHLAALAEIVAHSNAAIVITSSWRTVPQAMNILTASLAAFGLTIFDRTPDTGSSRAAEIAAWLAAHPDVEHFVIIDDEDFGYNRTKWLKTYASIGLLQIHVPLALAILTK